ncbi:unnamed protein product [Closterium sp. NIES-54]
MRSCSCLLRRRCHPPLLSLMLMHQGVGGGCGGGECDQPAAVPPPLLSPPAAPPAVGWGGKGEGVEGVTRHRQPASLSSCRPSSGVGSGGGGRVRGLQECLGVVFVCFFLCFCCTYLLY